MKVWLVATTIVGIATIVFGVWLQMSGQNAVVDIEGRAGFSLSGWVVGTGIALIVVAGTMLAVLLPVLATLRRARDSSPGSMIIVAQKTSDLEKLVRTTGSAITLPNYVVLSIGLLSLGVWARGRQLAELPKAGFGKVLVTEAVTSRRVPALELLDRNNIATGLKFVPSRARAELAPMLRASDVEALAARIRAVLE